MKSQLLLFCRMLRLRLVGNAALCVPYAANSNFIGKIFTFSLEVKNILCYIEFATQLNNTNFKGLFFYFGKNAFSILAIS